MLETVLRSREVVEPSDSRQNLGSWLSFDVTMACMCDDAPIFSLSVKGLRDMLFKVSAKFIQFSWWLHNLPRSTHSRVTSVTGVSVVLYMRKVVKLWSYGERV